MLKKLKMSYDKIRKAYDNSILKSLNDTVRRYSKEELREAISSEEGRVALAEKVFFQLPASTKSAFVDNDNAKDLFVADVVSRLSSILTTPKLHKKVFGTKAG